MLNNYHVYELLTVINLYQMLKKCDDVYYSRFDTTP